MTRDEAILLAVANARGVCTLTKREADEVDLVLLGESERVREDRAKASLRNAQEFVAMIDPARMCDGQINSATRDLGVEIAHYREVRDLMKKQRDDLRAAYSASLRAKMATPDVAREMDRRQEVLVNGSLPQSDGTTQQPS